MNSIISFLSGPIAPIFKHLEVSDLPEVPSADLADKLLNGIEGYELRESVRAKLDPFIREFGLDPDQFILIEGKDPWSRLDASMGSIRGGARGIIILSPKMVRDIDREFSKSLQFSIARTLTQFINDDHYTTANKQASDVSKLQVLAYGTTMAAACLLSPLSLALAHLACCAVSKATGTIRDMQHQRALVVSTDQMAAKRSQKFAKGGLVLMDVEKRTNLQCMKVLTQEADKLDAQNSSYTAQFAAKCMRLASKILVTKDGDSRFDFYSPSLSSRQSELARHTKK
jgi:hypothetical protein